MSAHILFLFFASLSVPFSSLYVYCVYLCMCVLLDDESIQSLNPTRHLPSTGIIMLLSAQPDDASLAISLACSKLFPSFTNVTGPVSPLPSWPYTSYARYQILADSYRVIAQLKENPYTFAISTLGLSKTFQANMISLVNAAGMTISPTLNSLSFAVSEKLVQVDDDGTIEAAQDLTLPVGASSYPFSITIFAWVHKDNFRSTCLAKVELAKFLL